MLVLRDTERGVLVRMGLKIRQQVVLRTVGLMGQQLVHVPHPAAPPHHLRLYHPDHLVERTRLIGVQPLGHLHQRFIRHDVPSFVTSISLGMTCTGVVEAFRCAR